MYNNWAKISDFKNAAPDDWHLVPYHCLDVGACMQEYLRRHPIVAQRGARILGISPSDLEASLIFLMVLHDLGKFGIPFQRKVFQDVDYRGPLVKNLVRPDFYEKITGRKVTLHDSMEAVHHGTSGWVFWKLFVQPELVSQGLVRDDEVFQSRNSGTKTSFLSKILSKPKKRASGSIESLFRVIAGHHGLPVGACKTKLEQITPDRHLADDTEAWIVEYVQSELTPEIQESVLDFVSEVLDFLPLPISHIPNWDDPEKRAAFLMWSWDLAGFQVVADWIGSDDKMFSFVKEEMPLAEYWKQHALPGAVASFDLHGLESVGLKGVTMFKGLFPGFTPRPAQEWADRVDLDPYEGNLIIIEDQTGSGKTEAAFLLASKLLTDEKNGVYMALPTQASSNQTFERIMEIIPQVWDEGVNLTLAHGSKSMNKSFTKLRFDNQNTDIKTSGFLARKAGSLLSQVAVGTVDQLMMSVMAKKHQAMKLTGLLSKVLIIDEVHGYDPYITQVLARLLEWCSSQDISIIILSATLTSEQRETLVKAYAPQATLTVGKGYPLITHVTNRSGLKAEEVLTAQRSYDLQVHYTDTEGVLWDQIEETLKKGGGVVWYQNTVKDAQARAKEARNKWGDHVYLYHSKYMRGDRSDNDREALVKWGPQSSPRTRKGLVIATQVLEESLDLDFDVTMSDLADISTLMQRWGRGRRHARDTRGNRLSAGAQDQRGLYHTHILGPTWEDDPDASWYRDMFFSASYVYQHVHHLWRTARLLHDDPLMSLPKEIRGSLEDVFSRDKSDLPADLLTFEDKREAELEAMQGKALEALLDLSAGYNASWQHEGWSDTTFATRLGVPTKIFRLCTIDAESGIKPLYEHGDKEVEKWRASQIQVTLYDIQGFEPKHPVTHDQINTYLDWVEKTEGKRGRYAIRPSKWETEVILYPQGDGSYQALLTFLDQNSKEHTRLWRYSKSLGLEVVKV